MASSSPSVKRMVNMAAADPAKSSADDPHQRLSTDEMKYYDLVRTKSKGNDGRSGFRGAFVHMNSEDASAEDQPMSEGNVILWKPDTKVTADMFPERFFGHVMATKIENPKSLSYYEDGLGELGAIHHSHAEEVSMKVRETPKKSGTDARAWTATLGSSSSMSGTYVDEHGPGVYDVWVVSHVNNNKLSAEFWEWLDKFGRDDKGVQKGATIENIVASRAYKDACGLARRNALRVHHNTELTVGVQNPVCVDDVMASCKDPRMDLPKLAQPQVHNTYNVFREGDVQSSAAQMFLNKTTSLEDSKGGIVVLTSPARNIYLYPFDADTVYRNSAASTVPMCMGRLAHKKDSKAKYDSTREADGIKNIVRSHMMWDDKQDHPDAKLSSAATRDDFRRMTSSRRELLEKTLNLPGTPIKLRPLAIKVGV